MQRGVLLVHLKMVFRSNDPLHLLPGRTENAKQITEFQKTTDIFFYESQPFNNIHNGRGGLIKKIYQHF